MIWVIIMCIYGISALYVYQVYSHRAKILSRIAEKEVKLTKARWFFVLCPFVNTMLALALLIKL